MPKRGILISVIWWLLIAAATVLLFVSHSSGRHRALTKFYTFGIAIFAVAGQTGINTFFDRQRLRTLNAELASKNFATNIDEGEPAQVLHYHAAPEHTAFRAFFSALGVQGDRPIHIAEYKFTIGEGKHASHSRVTEIAVDFLPTAPDLLITRKPGPSLKKPPAKPTTRADVHTDHTAFNNRWQASTAANPTTAAQLLRSDVLIFLSEADPSELQWRIKDGWLSCTWLKARQPSDLDPLITRVMTAAKLAESHQA
jgi:hypothetical protein